ncbi:sulfotransferase 1 family member D1-like [Ambystoma mexicanum]|uniref:sulfotransferase 1 family member D1-like n=1 Tax=Ambystoma mexicanum TaxID=8296 RepID=UPI0037E9106C
MAEPDPYLRQKLVPIRGVPMLDSLVENWPAVEAVQARPDDLLIATYPKAGTTWISEIVEMIYHDGDVEKCRRGGIHVRVPFMEMIFPGHPTGVQQLEAMKSPRLIKTHLAVQLLPKSFWETNCKIIYVARNAKDEAVSYFHFYQMAKAHPEPGTWQEYLQSFMSGDVAFGSWYDHVKGWWEKAKEHRILYLFYEDMKEDPRREVLKVLRFLDRDVSDDLLEKILHHTSFQEMKDNPMVNYGVVPSKYMDQSVSAFMRKGIAGDWKNVFTVAQNERFDEDYERKMAGSTLRFRTEI